MPDAEADIKKRRFTVVTLILMMFSLKSAAISGVVRRRFLKVPTYCYLSVLFFVADRGLSDYYNNRCIIAWAPKLTSIILEFNVK